MLRSAPSRIAIAPLAERLMALPFPQFHPSRGISFVGRREQNLLASYESSPGKVRRFCSNCGSQIVAERAGQSTVILRLGCVDTPITDRPKAHIWRSQGASWFDPKDPLPELPEGFA
jgi:hypothetical protein